MTSIDQEIVAYLDGEMRDAEISDFEARMKDDPMLRGAVALHREVLVRLRHAYPGSPEKRFDDRELAALGLLDPAPVVELGQARARNKRWATAAWTAAIAASLAGGIAIGQLSLWQRGFLVERNNRLLATTHLETALSDLPDNGRGYHARIGLTFRADEGLCRTFRVDNGYAGLACRSDAGWSIPMVVRSEDETPSSPDFALAGEAFPPSLMREVDSRIIGAPLTVAEVEQARRESWRQRKSGNRD